MLPSSLGRLVLPATLCLLIAACNMVFDTDQMSPTEPNTTAGVQVTFPADLPKVDSIRVRITLADSPSTPPLLERTLAGNEPLVLDSLPADRKLSIDVQGLSKQIDGTLATWWTSDTTLTFSGSSTVLPLPLAPQVGDTTPPRASAEATETAKLADSLFQLKWNLAGSDTIEVWIDGILVGKAVGTFSWNGLWPEGASKVVIAVFRDKAGNVSTDTVPVVRPHKVTTPRFRLAVLPSGIVDPDDLPYSLYDLTKIVVQDSTPEATVECSFDSGRTWMACPDTMTLSRSVRLLARASRSGWIPSDTSEQVFRVSTATPLDSRAYYTSNNSITTWLSSWTPGAKILYSLDTGKTWLEYRDSLLVERSGLLQARAVKSGLAEGAMGKWTYTITTAKPFFPYTEDSSDLPIAVAIESITKKAGIVYSLDSGKSWIPYNSEFWIDQDVEVWAKATREGATPSDIAKKTFRVANDPPHIDDSLEALPFFDKDGATFHGYVTVHIHTELPGAAIRYTLDGTDPSSSSPLYVDSVLVDTSCVLKARVFKDSMKPGPVMSRRFILANTGSIAMRTADGAIHWWTTKAKLSSDNPDLALHCTTDGSQATSASPLCEDSIDVTEGISIHVVGISRQWPRLPWVKAEFGAAVSWRKDIAYGTLVDARDGNHYRTVQMGSQNWMAENLRYAGSGDTIGECPDWIASNCGKFGRFYDWYDAMAGEKTSDSAPSGRKGVCPTGWHIPSKAEWSTLISFVGSPSATKLKATTSWDSARNGTDDYGFRLLASGANFSRDWMTVGRSSELWTSNHVGVDYGWSAHFGYFQTSAGYTDSGVVLRESPDLYHLAVRCVEN